MGENEFDELVKAMAAAIDEHTERLYKYVLGYLERDALARVAAETARTHSRLVLGREAGTDMGDAAAEVPAPVRDGATEWVERAIRRTLTEDQARCFRVLCAVRAPHNLPLIGDGWNGAVPSTESGGLAGLLVEGDLPPVLAPVEIAEWGVIARLRCSLSTFDFDDLTRLVLAAHEYAVRVEVRSAVYLWIDKESYLSSYDLGTGKWMETDEHPSGPGACLEVLLHPRQREGGSTVRHPSMAEVLADAGRAAT